MTRLFITVLSLAAATFGVAGQAMYFDSARMGSDKARKADSRVSEISTTVPEGRPDTIRSIEEIDAWLANDSIPRDTVMVMKPLPDFFFSPAVFCEYIYADTVAPFTPDYSGRPELRWLEEFNAQERTMRNAQRYFFNNHPDKVRYNIALLPEAPKEYHAVLNPEDHTIEIKEVIKDAPMAPTIAAAEVKKRHWIRTFNASLQFSQAYVSPNWYQGGNNNLNMLANIYYNVKLNPEYHPKLLFETTAQVLLAHMPVQDPAPELLPQQFARGEGFVPVARGTYRRSRYDLQLCQYQKDRDFRCLDSSPLVQHAYMPRPPHRPRDLQYRQWPSRAEQLR